MSARDRLNAGKEALASGNWGLATNAFEAALNDDKSPEALDGLGQALWWLKDARAAIEIRARAYAAYKQEGRIPEAAMLAEIVSLARIGLVPTTGADRSTRSRLLRAILLRVAMGDVELGIKCLDEALAAACAGEASDLQNVGYAYCALLETAEMLGDRERFSQWTSAIREIRGDGGFGPLDDFASSTGAGNLSAFCGACCGGVCLVTGRLDQAEDELRRAIADLAASGMESRCVHPATQLAELQALQGKFEEAGELLERYEHLPEAVRPLAIIDLGLGAPDAATARLRRRLDDLQSLAVAALPLWTVLVDAQIARGDLDGASNAAGKIVETARLTASKRHRGEALFAEGKVAAARSEENSHRILREAARALSEASMALTACRARMALARTLVDRDRPLAISEARSALAAFDRLGALPDADEAAAFLRSLGIKGRTGPKNLELLSKRELEVLRLISQGLSNADISERLFISIKTAGHHVSNILSKLGLRSRTEAAAYAGLHLSRQSMEK